VTVVVDACHPIIAFCSICCADSTLSLMHFSVNKPQNFGFGDTLVRIISNKTYYDSSCLMVGWLVRSFVRPTASLAAKRATDGGRSTSFHDRSQPYNESYLTGRVVSNKHSNNRYVRDTTPHPAAEQLLVQLATAFPYTNRRTCIHKYMFVTVSRFRAVLAVPHPRLLHAIDDTVYMIMTSLTFCAWLCDNRPHHAYIAAVENC